MFAFRGLVWSPSNRQIAVLLEHPTGTNIYTRGLRIFSVMSGEDYLFDHHDYEVFVDVNTYEISLQTQATWNSDGTLLALTRGDTLQIHVPLGDGTPLVSSPAYNIVDLKWSADNRFIAAGSEDGTIRLWAVLSGE